MKYYNHNLKYDCNSIYILYGNNLLINIVNLLLYIFPYIIYYFIYNSIRLYIIPLP